MYVQFAASSLEVNIAERLESADFQFREFYKHAPISREALKVGMALPIQTGTHLLDLKIGHVTYPSAQRALMSPWAGELKTLYQASRRQHLAWWAHNLGKARIIGKNTDNVSTACNPDNRLVLLSIQMPVGINLEKLRMQRPLKETKRELFDSHIDLR
jgi:hypothetical protein